MPQNAERLGAAGRANFGACPKESEGAFLAALERGRGLASTPAGWPYYEQMRQTENILVAAASDAERERLRGQLRELEWWSVFILNHPGPIRAEMGANREEDSVNVRFGSKAAIGDPQLSTLSGHSLQPPGS